jgi:membrane-associated protease RseP (regulator of RpoE activity)
VKKLIPGVLIALSVIVLTAFVLVRLVGSSQASEDKPPSAAQQQPSLADDSGPAQPEAAAPLKGSLQQEGDEDDDAETRPYIGIMVAPLGQARAQELGIEGGAVVARVLADGPSAGKLQNGDVIKAINGDAISGVEELIEKVQGSAPGDVLTIEVIRNGGTVSVEVTVGERAVPEARPFAGDLPGVYNRLLGHLRNLDRFVRAEVVVETDDGFKTIRAVVGTVTSVDASANTFVLAPKDGAASITYTVSEDTAVVMRRNGDISGLNTEDPTLVVDVDGKVELVYQADELRFPHMAPHGFEGFPHGLRGRFDGREFNAPGFFLDKVPPEIRRKLEQGGLNLDQLMDRLRERQPVRPATPATPGQSF